MSSRKKLYFAFIAFGLYELIFLGGDVGIITLVLAGLGLSFEYYQTIKLNNKNEKEWYKK